MQHFHPSRSSGCISIFLFLTFILQAYTGHAQCVNNMLVNPSFESPVVSTINGNNLVGSSWGGWSSQNGAGLNIIRVNGSSYSSGADNAAQGTQYLDIAGASDFPVQSFTLTVPSICYFSGKFSNRETYPGFVNWTARVDILDASNNVVATSNSKLMTISVNMEIWYMMGGESAVLPAGNYKYRAFVGDYGHFDDAFLCVQAASAVCTNRIMEASFETPVQASNNMITSVGTSYNGWYTQNGSNIQITKVDGTGYALGPDVAFAGSQYMSLSGLNDYLVRDFSISCPTTVDFSGYFANRPNASYTNWTGAIEILNSSNAVIATSTTRAFTSGTPKDSWYQLYGSTATLPVGDYKYRINLSKEGNFDAGYMCVTAVSCAVLPVTYKTFTAAKNSEGVILKWTTAQEQNSLSFDIQHSTDGISWSTVGTVQAAGNSNTERSYNYLHSNLVKGTNYYRLQQNDLDGEKSYSVVKLLKIGTDLSSFTLQQATPGSRRLQVNVSSNQTLRIFAGDGKLLFQKNYNAGTQYISLPNYNTGVYLLSNGQKTERFIIN